MRYLLLLLVCPVLMFIGCKKRICGKIAMISTDVSPANGQPVYTFYLETGEQIRASSRNGYQVGEAYCND